MEEPTFDDLENMDINTGNKPGLNFEEIVDRYWHLLPINKQKEIVKAAYTKVMELNTYINTEVQKIIDKDKNGEWYVYILRCKDGALYTGYTNDLSKRIQKHNEGKGSRSVKAHGTPAFLAYFETFETKSQALKKEALIKKLSKVEKEFLVKGF